MARVNISVNIIQQGYVNVQNFTDVINKYEYMLQIIKINDIIYTADTNNNIAKRYELSQTHHTDLKMLIQDINFVISNIYRDNINLNNIAAIAKKRSNYKNIK